MSDRLEVLLPSKLLFVFYFRYSSSPSSSPLDFQIPFLFIVSLFFINVEINCSIICHSRDDLKLKLAFFMLTKDCRLLNFQNFFSYSVKYDMPTDGLVSHEIG